MNWKSICKSVVFGVAALTTVSFAGMETITNDVFWKDTDGNFIYSQGGGAFKFGDTYYWYGVHYVEAEAYAKDMANKDDGKLTDFKSVTVYSSKDLVNWKFENDVLTAKSKGFTYAYWFGRLGVCYNKKTKKYVLIAQHNDSVLFATSDSPTGNFEVQNIQDYIPGLPTNKMGTGDQTLFIDDDGTPYIICSNKGGRGHQYVVPLRASDYLAAEQAVEVAKGYGREGNALFKHNGKYYFCASDLHGWNSSHTYYMMSDNIYGPYTSWAIMDGSAEDFSHVTQTGFFVTVYGTKGSFVINAGDRWSEFAGNGPGYNQWVPITFDSKGIPKFHSLSQWKMDAVTGEWEVGEKNNYCLNFSFDADRVDQATVAGWQISPVNGTVNPRSKKRTGNRGLYLTETKTASQTLSVPNGIYDFTAWMQSSGGQAEAKLFAKDFGGSEMSASATKAMSGWTQVKVSNIKVTNGKITIGAMTNGGWIAMDDLELIKQMGKTFNVNAISGIGGIIETSAKGGFAKDGSKVTFTAKPLDGWEFVKWDGSVTGSDTNAEIASLKADANVSAEFKFTSKDSLNYEAENTIYNAAAFEDLHLGFSGKGYANVDNVVGSSVEFAVVMPKTETRKAKIIFANGSTKARPMSLSVNGKVIIDSIDFESTAEWTVWTEKEVEIPVEEGVNTIALTSLTADGGPNLDILKFNSTANTDPGTLAIFSEINIQKPVVRYNAHNHSLNIWNASSVKGVQLFDVCGHKIAQYSLGNSEAELSLPATISGGMYILKIIGTTTESSGIERIAITK